MGGWVALHCLDTLQLAEGREHMQSGREARKRRQLAPRHVHPIEARQLATPNVRLGDTRQLASWG
jgi:hypothetical protein